VDEMEKAISMLEKEIDSDSYFYKALIRAKCIFLARTGKIEEAKRLIDRQLRNYPESYRKKLHQKLETLSY
jgi:tetratricopeptide (TPR) repeat protein